MHKIKRRVVMGEELCTRFDISPQTLNNIRHRYASFFPAPLVEKGALSLWRKVEADRALNLAIANQRLRFSADMHAIHRGLALCMMLLAKGRKLEANVCKKAAAGCGLETWRYEMARLHETKRALSKKIINISRRSLLQVRSALATLADMPDSFELDGVTADQERECELFPEGTQGLKMAKLAIGDGGSRRVLLKKLASAEVQLTSVYRQGSDWLAQTQSAGEAGLTLTTLIRWPDANATQEDIDKFKKECKKRGAKMYRATADHAQIMQVYRGIAAKWGERKAERRAWMINAERQWQEVAPQPSHKGGVLFRFAVWLANKAA